MIADRGHGYSSPLRRAGCGALPVQSLPKPEVLVWILDSAVRRHRSCVHLRPAQARRRPGSRAGSPAALLSTIAGVLPEADVARVRELCTGRVPGHARNQVRVELEQSRQAVTIVECRPARLVGLTGSSMRSSATRSASSGAEPPTKSARALGGRPRAEPGRTPAPRDRTRMAQLDHSWV